MVQQLQQKTAGAAIAKPPVARVFATQLMVLAVASAGLLSIDKTTAYSALLGGLISIGPNAYFARWAFRYSGARAANDVARSFYRGEAGKFLLTALLFASVFALVKPLAVTVLFISYIVLMALNGLLALRYLK